MISSDRRAADLWAITSYFNPAGYRRRLVNYRIFRERFTLPLVAVELAYGPAFELQKTDADILVQLRGGDVLWQKERLLNVGLGALPQTCRKVVSVDCDIVFESDDWAARVSHMLDRFPLGQTFSHAHFMPRDWKLGESRRVGAEFTSPSIAFAAASGLPVSASLSAIKIGEHPEYATGFSWAARREFIHQYGFYDGCIIGGGDRALASAAYGCFDHVIKRFHMNDRAKAHYLAWAEPFHNAAAGTAGFIDGDIYHLWHGEIRDRHYGERMRFLAPFDFDPFEDIVIGDNGCWRWNTEKPQMHEYVRKYFASRKEDG